MSLFIGFLWALRGFLLLCSPCLAFINLVQASYNIVGDIVCLVGIKKVVTLLGKDEGIFLILIIYIVRRGTSQGAEACAGSKTLKKN